MKILRMSLKWKRLPLYFFLILSLFKLDINAENNKCVPITREDYNMLPFDGILCPAEKIEKCLKMKFSLESLEKECKLKEDVFHHKEAEYQKLVKELRNQLGKKLWWEKYDFQFGLGAGFILSILIIELILALK